MIESVHAVKGLIHTLGVCLMQRSNRQIFRKSLVIRLASLMKKSIIIYPYQLFDDRRLLMECDFVRRFLRYDIELQCWLYRVNHFCLCVFLFYPLPLIFLKLLFLLPKKCLAKRRIHFPLLY